MPSFLISFRLVDGPDYQRRYTDLNTAITTAGGGRAWFGTTSFAVIKGSWREDQLAERLHSAARLRPEDFVLVFQHGVQAGHSNGAVPNLTLLNALLSP